MTIPVDAARQPYRARIGSAIMTLDGQRRSCLIFTAVEPVDEATPAHRHDMLNHIRTDEHVGAAMAVLRTKGTQGVLEKTSWAADDRHIVAVGSCCLAPVDLECLMQLVIDSFNSDDDLGIRLLPCACEENCTCTPATCGIKATA